MLVSTQTFTGQNIFTGLVSFSSQVYLHQITVSSTSSVFSDLGVNVSCLAWNVFPGVKITISSGTYRVTGHAVGQESANTGKEMIIIRLSSGSVAGAGLIGSAHIGNWGDNDISGGKSIVDANASEILTFTTSTSLYWQGEAITWVGGCGTTQIYLRGDFGATFITAERIQ